MRQYQSNLIICGNFISIKFKVGITLAVITSALAIGNAFAIPIHMTFTTYFSDAIKTKVVGEAEVLCKWRK